MRLQISGGIEKDPELCCGFIKPEFVWNLKLLRQASAVARMVTLTANFVILVGIYGNMKLL